MKHLFTLLVLCTAGLSLSAQTANAVVFSENGEKFTLLLNGEKQNDKPQANVKVTGLTGEFYQARVDFEDPSLADFSNNNFAVRGGIEVTYMIKVNKKGEYVLRYQSEAPISSTASAQPAAQPNTQAKQYAIVDDAEVEEEVVESTPATTVKTTTSTTGGVGVNQSVTVTEKTTTTAPVKGESVNVNMNVNGLNMGINMNVDGMDMEGESTMTTTTTTTTSSSSSGQTTQVADRKPVREEIVVQEVSGCARPMEKSAFDKAKQSIADKGFDETRLTMAKQVTKANCLTAAQIVEVMNTFGFEETKLEYAKFAYDYCFDQGNYFTVNDAFSFESSIEELNQYLETK